MARASLHTLLGLDNFARIMGINPVHFAGAYADPIWPQIGCDDLWPQYTWQSDALVSREELAEAIRGAELDVTSALGYFPAPTWVEEEVHPVDRVTRMDDVYAHRIKERLDFGKVSAPGRKATVLIEESAPIVYSDEDLDTWEETATVTVAAIDQDIPLNEVRIFFPGYDGFETMEIRPIKSITYDGVGATIVFDAWLAVPLALWEAYPTSGDYLGINLADEDNRITEVDVYRVYNDETQVAAEFLVETTSGIATVTGTFRVLDAGTGVVNPFVATCDGSLWNESLACYGKLLMVKYYYYSGNFPQERTLDGRRIEMTQYLAEAIAWMASARVTRPVCGCSNIQAIFDELRVDLTRVDRRSFNMISEEKMNNPFGTRVGEVRAWDRISKMASRISYSAVAV